MPYIVGNIPRSAPFEDKDAADGRAVKVKSETQLEQAWAV